MRTLFNACRNYSNIKIIIFLILEHQRFFQTQASPSRLQNLTPEFQTASVCTAVKDQIQKTQNNLSSPIHAQAASSVNHTQTQNMDQVGRKMQVIQKLEVTTIAILVPLISH